MIENMSMILKGGLIIIFIALALIIAVAPSLTKKEGGDQDEIMVNDVEQLISNLRKNWISPAKYLEIRGYIPKDFAMETDSNAAEQATAPTDSVETTTVKKNETIDTTLDVGDISQNSTSANSTMDVTTESTTQSASTTAATTTKPSNPAVNMSSEAMQAAKKKSFLNKFKNKVINLFAKSDKDNHDNINANPLRHETVPVSNKAVEQPSIKNSISNNITKHSSSFDELIEDYILDEDYPDYRDEAAIDGDDANNAAKNPVEAPTQAVENTVPGTEETDEVAVVDKKEEKDKDKADFQVIKEQDIDLLKKYILCLKANDKPQRKTSYNTKTELENNLNKSLTAAAQVNPCTKVLDKDLKFQYQNKSSAAAPANTEPCPTTTTPACPTTTTPACPTTTTRACPPKPPCPISTTPTPCPVKTKPKKTKKPDCKEKAGAAVENATEPVTLPFDSLALVNSLNITSHLDEGNSSCPNKCSDKPETPEISDPESAQYAKFLNRLKYMAHSHHAVDVIGKPPHKPLDLLKVQKMIDAAKMETMRLEGDKKPQCGCKRENAAVIPGSNIYNARVRRGDAFSQKLNRIITELKDSANKHKNKNNNIADSDTSDYYDYDEIDSHYDDPTETKKNREVDTQRKGVAEKRIMRKSKKKKKKKKKKKRRKNDSHDDYDDDLVQLLREKKQPTNEEIADKMNDHEIIDIRNHVGPNQEMALNQFLSNLDESPQQFHFDVEPFLKSRSHLYEYPASRITKDVVPEKMYYDFAQNKKKRKRQLPTQIDDISLLPSYTYAQNLLNEKFNAYQFKDPDNDQTAMERFYLLNDGGANIDDVYKRPKEVSDPVVKTNLNDLFMDLKLDKDFQDLDFERFKLYNLNPSNYTPTLF